MKVLALGDPHGKLPKGMSDIIRNNNIEAIICIGEVYPIERYGVSHGIPDLSAGERTLKKICMYNLPTIFFKGNMFLSDDGAKYFRNLIDKFKKMYPELIYKNLDYAVINGIRFILVDMIYEKHSHKDLKKKYINPIRNGIIKIRINSLFKKYPAAILLSHAPPYGYLDKTTRGKHVGSKILLSIIKKNKPKIVICGHIHEAKGRSRIGETIIYNLGCCGD